MLNKTLKVIGINPGTRYLGIAILQNQISLRDWRISGFKGKWTTEKEDKILATIVSYINFYEPQIISLKKLHPSRRSANLIRLVARIKRLTRRKGITIYQYSIKELEAMFIPDGKMNKKRLIEIMADKFPSLLYELAKEENNKNSYYARLFEAVALALATFNQLNK